MQAPVRPGDIPLTPSMGGRVSAKVTTRPNPTGPAAPMAGRGGGGRSGHDPAYPGKNNMLASSLEDMAELLDTLDDHPRLKVCFDTCHAMGAGYDLHDPATCTATADELDKHLPGRLALVHATSG